MTPRFIDECELFQGTAVVSGGEGNFSLDISEAEFENVLHVSLSTKAGDFSKANAPLASTLVSFDSSRVDGKAFKATSAGLLAAMQQTAAEDGTEVDILIIGQMEEITMYKTIVKFIDNDGRIYEVGSEYPREGLEASPERIKELSTTENKAGIIVIETIKKRKTRKKTEE